jgi:hypothetical protein
MASEDVGRWVGVAMCIVIFRGTYWLSGFESGFAAPGRLNPYLFAVSLEVGRLTKGFAKMLVTLNGIRALFFSLF